MIKLKNLLELSFSQLYAKTPDRYRIRARDIIVKLKSIKNGRYYYQTNTVSNNHVHNQLVKPRPGKFKVNGINDNVIVWCDCEDFTYENEWLLWKQNTSNIVNSNGQPLRFRNPDKLPKLCKHLTAVLDDFKRRANKK